MRNRREAAKEILDALDFSPEKIIDFPPKYKALPRFMKFRPKYEAGGFIFGLFWGGALPPDSWRHPTRRTQRRRSTSLPANSASAEVDLPGGQNYHKTP